MNSSYGTNDVPDPGACPMSNRDQSPKPSQSERDASAPMGGPSSGSNPAGTGDNPQDGKDTAQSGAARPRGKTEDPDRTL